MERENKEREREREREESAQIEMDTDNDREQDQHAVQRKKESKEGRRGTEKENEVKTTAEEERSGLYIRRRQPGT